MRVLFTGFTSRTVGSDRNTYDYISNVFVLQRALELAGHQVDVRTVSLETDPCVEEDYDAAVVGIATCNGLNTRFKLGACWTLHRFGRRAGLFPSDGRNLFIFPNSVRTCITGQHYDRRADKQLDPVEYFLGDLQYPNNVLDEALGHEPHFVEVWRDVLRRLPSSEDERNRKCDWQLLIPMHSWGNKRVYEAHFGAPVTPWDPTNVAIPMQFGDLADGTARIPLDHHGRVLFHDTPVTERRKAWLVTSLQDQSPWIKKQKCKWSVIEVGNKRKAREGKGHEYVPEKEIVTQWYPQYWGHLAFGYPLADGGWWRMRYVHAAKAGIVTCCDEDDARRMPNDYRHSRNMLERWGDTNTGKLYEVAENQHAQLMASAWPSDRAVEAVDNFVKGLKG